MAAATHDLTFTAPTAGYEDVLTPEAVAFTAELGARFGPRVRELLADRQAKQASRDAGEALDFLPETAQVRAGDWRVAPLPADAQQECIRMATIPRPPAPPECARAATRQAPHLDAATPLAARIPSARPSAAPVRLVLVVNSGKTRQGPIDRSPTRL